MFKKITAIMVITLIAAGSFAQTPDFILSKLSPDALRSDFLLLRDTLQKIHPGLYRYKSKKTMDRIFDSCLATIQDSMTIPGFYGLTSFVIASMEDGHSNSRLPRPLLTDYMNNIKVFPSMVLFIHSHAFIYCCKQNPNLAGAEILSINHHAMKEIIKRLFTYIPSDGNIASRKNWEMPENFQLLYNIVYGTAESYAITCKTQTGEVKTTILLADTIKNILCPSPFHRPDKYLKLSYAQDDIAVLTVSTFFNEFLKPTGENFRRFLDSAFTGMKARKIQKLIIDLRSNQGGNDDNGIMLYSYLTSRPFRYYTSQETTKGKRTEEEEPELRLQQPDENNFTGKVYILINGRSFSGTAEFSAIARSQNRAIFIGEECGGGYYGNTSGEDAMVTLPNTQITTRVPMVKYTMAVKPARYPDRGVIPDHIIYPTIADIIKNRDPQLEYTLKLVQRD